MKDATGYNLTRRDGVIERYDAAGQLLSETDRAGQITSYVYNGSQLASVTESNGHTLGFSYTPSGRLASVTDSGGHVISFTYASVPSDGQAYSSAVLADSPEGYWRLKDASGTTAASEQAGVSAGTYGGTYTLNQEGPGAGSGAVYFNASGDGEVNLQQTANYTSQLTIETWVNPDPTQPDSLAHVFTKNALCAASYTDFPVRLDYSPASGFNVVLSTGNDYAADAMLSSGAVTPGQCIT